MLSCSLMNFPPKRLSIKNNPYFLIVNNKEWLNPGVFKPILEDTKHCTFCMYPSYDTSTSGFAVSSNELGSHL